MAKVYLIEDDTIGGVDREYVEVDRKANVGDYVRLLFTGSVIKVREGDESEVDSQINDGMIKTLEPTDIVVIDDIRYRLAERRAEVGEKVIVTVKHTQFFKIGDVFEVVHNDFAIPAVGDEKYNNILEGLYSVLIPVDSEPAEPTPDIHDLIANLAQRVTSLERITGELVRAKSSLESQLLDAQRNTERLAQELEREKEFRASIYVKVSDLKDLTESNTKDIAFLDERTEQPKKPTKSADELLRDILRLIEENGGAGA